MKLKDIKVHEDFYHNGKLWRKIARHRACGIGEENKGKDLVILSCTEITPAGTKA